MSFFSKAAAMAKSAATATVAASKKAYSEMNAHPTTVTCATEGCATVLGVPGTLWAWTCSAGHENTDGLTCGECQVSKEPLEPTITCALCKGLTPVPRTVAIQMARKTADTVKTGVTGAVDWSKKTYNEMKSRPETCICSGCKAVLAVPAEAWDWTCPDGHANTGEMAVCGDAGCGKKGGSSPKVACPTCQTETAVPTSVAAVRLAVAVETTKTTAMQAREASEKQYNHWVAVPEQFNCQKCNAKLMVPPPQVWMCQTAGCGTNNTPDVVECSVCKQKLKPKVMCGVCMTVTDIPSNNFLNSVRSTRNNTVKAVDDVKKTASFVSENRESVRAAGAFVQENPEIGKAVAKSAK